MNKVGAPLVVIAGQTGSGKSALALKIAEQFPVEIVSADSVQVYRGFDIGSAKPSPAELTQLPHHAIDIIDPDQAIDAAAYARLADDAIASIVARGKIPLVVGGTGLWLRALLMGLVDLPAVDAELRARLESEAKTLGSQALHDRLAAIDPLSAEQIHANDQLRIVRALEVYAQTGSPLGELRRNHALGKPRYTFAMLVLEHSADELRPQLLRRTHHMLELGWIEEVRALLHSWPAEARAFGSVGYREVCAHLRGKVTTQDLPELIERETWRYAKRQRNWFRAEQYVQCRGTFAHFEQHAYDIIADLLS